MVLVVLIVGAIATAMGRFYATRWPMGDLVGMVATGEETALLFREADESPYFEVEMVHVDRLEGPRWRKGLYRLQLPPGRGVTVGPDTITVRASDVDGHLETHAFDRDGAFLWRRRAYDEPPPNWEEGARSYRVGGTAFEVYGGPSGSVHLIRIRPEERGAVREEGVASPDGDVVARVDLPGQSPTESRATSRGLLVRRGDRVWFLLPTGDLVPRVQSGAVCLVHDGALAQRGDDLVFVTANDGAEHLVATGWNALPDAQCMHRRSHFVVASEGVLIGLGEEGIRWRHDETGSLRSFGGAAGLVGVQRDDALAVYDVSNGQRRASASVSAAAEVQWVGAESHLFARVQESLWRFAPEAEPVHVRVEHGSAERFPLSRGHLAPGRVWVANAADARPLDATTLRPLRSLAQLPQVTPVSDIASANGS